MRRPRTRSAAVLLALVLCTCTDAPTGLRHGEGQLSLTPTYSREAHDIAQSLVAAGLAIDKIFIEVRGATGDVRASQLLDFPTDQSQVTLTLKVRLTSARERLTATIELRSGATAIFASTTPVTVWQSQTTTAQTSPLTYVGPGAAATTLKVQPPQATIAQTGAQQFAANALAANQSPVADLPITGWTSSDPSIATVSAAGLVQGVKSGTVTITARALNLLVATASLHVVGLPARLAVLGGTAQSVTVGGTLAQQFQIQVLSAAGEGVPGMTINFQAVTAGGSVGTAAATTDTQGIASTTVSVGTAAGAYEFRAMLAGAGTSGPQPASITATANAGAAAAITKVSGDAQSGTSGQALAAPLVVRVSDAYGNAVGGATVTFTRVSGTGVVSTSRVVTGSDGLASTGYTLGTASGSESIRADVSGLTGIAATFSLTSNAGAPSAVAAPSGDAQHLTVGASPSAPLVALVTDSHGNPVPGVTVSWRITSGPGSLSGDHSVTNALGEATITFTTDGRAGTTVINATVGGSSKDFTVVVDAGAPALFSMVSGNGQTGTVGAALAAQLSVLITDAHANPVAGVAVTFTAAANGGGIVAGPSVNSAATVSTDASGVARVTWQLGGAVGPQSVSASATGLPSLTFTATAVAGAASHITITAGTSGQSAAAGTALAIAPSVRVTDSFDNPVAGLAVTFAPSAGSLVNATTTTDANGVASAGSWTLGTGPGPQTLTATAGSLTVTFSATALPTFTITMTGSGSGSVSSQPTAMACLLTSGAPSGTCTAVLPYGQNVTLTATPQSNSTFGGFSGACADKNPCVLTMTQSQTIAATFAPIQQMLTISGGAGNGTITSSPAGIACTIKNGVASGAGCSAAFSDGTAVSLAEAPAAGYKFAGWAGACSGSDGCVIPMTQTQTVRASFSLGTWTTMSIPTSAVLHGIWGSSATRVFAVGANGTVLGFDGTSWSSLTSDAITANLWDAWGSSSSDVYGAANAMMAQGQLAHFDGGRWSAITAPTSQSLYGVWGSSSNDVFVSGDNGTLLHFDGKGAWTPISTGTTSLLFSVWGSSPTDVYIVGLNATALHYNGQNVTPIDLPNITVEPNGAREALGTVWGSSPTDVWIGGGLSSGDVWHFDGRTWTKSTLWTIAGSTGQGVNGLWGSSSSDIWAVGQSSAYHFDGSSWTAASLPAEGSTTLLRVWGTGSLNIFATGISGGAGVILRYQ